MIPSWLLRILPQLSGVLAIIGAFLWIDHRGFARAQAERDHRDATLIARLHTEMRTSEARLVDAIQSADASYQRQRAGIETARTALQPVLTREILREKRLANPAAGLTPGLLEAVNRARATSACSTRAAGFIACPLPAAQPHR